MATGARGEGWLDEADRKYPILFTNRALADAERALGKSILEVVETVHERKLSLDDLARVLVIGLEYGRKDAGDQRKSYTRDDAFGLLDEFGFGQIASTVFEALAAVLSYAPAKSETDANPPE